ncbi:hypothetical protein M0805_009320 [Coniferiporia weirii]|nr:hypothetical protein M0805_009320 [Coniferiporia weirii]
MMTSAKLEHHQTADLASPTLSEPGYDSVYVPTGAVDDDYADEIVWSVSSQSTATSPVLVDDTRSNGSGGKTAGSSPYSTRNTTEAKSRPLHVEADAAADAYLDSFVLVRGDYGTKQYIPPPNIQRRRGHRSTQSDSALALAVPTSPLSRAAYDSIRRPAVGTARDGPPKPISQVKAETKAWADDVDCLGRQMERASLATSAPVRTRSVQGSRRVRPGKRERSSRRPRDVPVKTKDAVRSYPSPAPSPSPNRGGSSTAKLSGTGDALNAVTRKDRGKKSPGKVKKSTYKSRAREIPLLEVVSPVPSSPRGLGARSVVDDVSENGDALVQTTFDAETDRLLGMAYDEAVKFMNGFIQHPHYYTSKASKLTFLQALIVELGLVSTTGPTRALPGTLTAAKTLLKTHAFLNVRDYLTAREQGLNALRDAMRPSKKALVRELQGRESGGRREKGGRRAPLGWVKETGLTVLLVSCHH